MHLKLSLVCIGRIEIALDDLCQKWRAYITLKNHRDRILADAAISSGYVSRTVSMARNLRDQLFKRKPKTKPETSFERLCSLVEVFHASQLVTHPAAIIQSEREALQQPDPDDEETDFIALLIETRDQQASDARDKVYALLGMVKNIQTLPLIPIDYTISKQAVYISTARALLQKDLKVLLLVESPYRKVEVQAISQKGDKLPSWVPDFETRQSATAFNILIYNANFAAAPPGPPELRFEDDILILKGIYIATVTKTRLVHTEIDPSKDMGNRMTLFQYTKDPGTRYNASTANETLGFYINGQKAKMEKIF